MPGRSLDEPSSDSRSSKETELCNSCSRINFRNAFYHEIRRRQMGRWIDIVRSTNCAFCRLMVSSIKRGSRNCWPNNEDEIFVTNALSWELGIEKSPYDSTKNDSYSNKFDLRSKSAKCDYKAYRLIVEVEERPEIYGVLQRVCRDDTSPERDFFGRPVDPYMIDIGLLRHWIKRCERWHGDNCGEDGVAGRNLPYDLRLIDVRRRRIVTCPGQSKQSYLTLSYVWGVKAMEAETGSVPQTLTKSMIEKDKDGREDTPLPNNLPRTIDNAIRLTRDLEFDYLWLDALCIVQDDPPEEKDKSLHRMDAIYNCSELTIVAASGHHADVGIPGIGLERREAPYTETIDKIRISTTSPSYSDLENSRDLTWNTRGWTFQEKILAKRILLFTDHQVYFKCAESIWVEEAYMETDELSKSMEARPEKYRWGPDRPQSHKFIPTDKTLLLRLVFPQLNIDDPWGYLGKFSDYAAALREYTCRALSNPGDKLKAIHGVFRTLRSDTGDFHHGHPEKYFLQSLLWHPVAGSRLLRSDPRLPSWSWAGWETDKGIAYDVLDVRVLSSIMLALRDLLKRAVKLMTAIFGGLGPGASSSTGSTSTSSAPYSSYSSASSSSSGSSSHSYSSQESAFTRWYRHRDWSTRNIARQTVGNIAVIFALPLLDRRHTVSELYVCETGKVSGIECDESLRLNTFLEDDIGAGKARPKAQPPKMTNSRRHELEYLSLGSRCPFLSLRTVVVYFRIGRCLQKPPPAYDDEVSVFELLDAEHRCVGEVWTTLEVSKRRRSKRLPFLTISWGLSLTFASITEQYIPRWTLDAAKLPESQIFNKWRPGIENMFKAPTRKTLVRRDVANSKNEYTVMSFLDSLFTARAKEPLPKSLWSTVNLLLADIDGQSAKRLGVARVIFGAWLMDAKFNTPEEILLE